MSAHEIKTPGSHPKERIQYSEHDESLKSRTLQKSLHFLHHLRHHYLTQATFMSEHVIVMYILCYYMNLMLQGTRWEGEGSSKQHN